MQFKVNTDSSDFIDATLRHDVAVAPIRWARLAERIRRCLRRAAPAPPALEDPANLDVRLRSDVGLGMEDGDGSRPRGRKGNVHAPVDPFTMRHGF